MYIVLMERAAHRRQSSLEINPYPEFLLFIFHPGKEYSTKFLTRRNQPRGPIPYSYNPFLTFLYTFIDKNSISFNCCKCTVVYIRASVNRFGPFYKRSWQISLSVSYTVHILQVLKSLPLVPEAWKWSAPLGFSVLPGNAYITRWLVVSFLRLSNFFIITIRTSKFLKGTHIRLAASQ